MRPNVEVFQEWVSDAMFGPLLGTVPEYIRD